jgi:hypothetical protein
MCIILMHLLDGVRSIAFSDALQRCMFKLQALRHSSCKHAGAMRALHWKTRKLIRGTNALVCERTLRHHLVQVGAIDSCTVTRTSKQLGRAKILSTFESICDNLVINRPRLFVVEQHG